MAVSIKKESISSIKHKLLRPSLTSHYLCSFTLPDSDFFTARNISSDATKLYDRLSLACNEASLPGSSLATIDINNDYHGVSEKHAYRRLYDDRADFTFYVDAEEYFVIKLFQTWIAYCVDEQFEGERIKGYDYTYRVNYPEEYYSPAMSISKFERDYGLSSGSQSLTYNFVGAFPISISSMPVSYDASNLLKCTVSFSYQRYYLSSEVIPSLNARSNQNAPGVAELSKVITKTGGNTPLTPSAEQSLLSDPRAQQFNTRNILNNRAFVRTTNINELG
jgi:hypothetical protein